MARALGLDDAVFHLAITPASRLLHMSVRAWL